MRPGIAPVSTALLLYPILVLLSLVCVNAQIGLPFPWQSNVRQINADFCSHLHGVLMDSLNNRAQGNEAPIFAVDTNKDHVTISLSYASQRSNRIG
jgi:hypothetical protein